MSKTPMWIALTVLLIIPIHYDMTSSVFVLLFFFANLINALRFVYTACPFNRIENKYIGSNHYGTMEERLYTHLFFSIENRITRRGVVK